MHSSAKRCSSVMRTARENIQYCRWAEEGWGDVTVGRLLRRASRSIGRGEDDVCPRRKVSRPLALGYSLGLRMRARRSRAGDKRRIWIDKGLPAGKILLTAADIVALIGALIGSDFSAPASDAEWFIGKIYTGTCSASPRQPRNLDFVSIRIGESAKPRNCPETSPVFSFHYRRFVFAQFEAKRRAPRHCLYDRCYLSYMLLWLLWRRALISFGVSECF